ncbi:hypothetical protein Lal_00040109, partial [Lupinus albus]
MTDTDSTPKKVVFTTKDLMGNYLTCTLTDQFFTQFMTYIANHKVGHVVVLTLAQISEAKHLQLVAEGYPVTIQNTMYDSKLYINDSIPEIELFVGVFHSLFLDYTKSYKSYGQYMNRSSSCSEFGSQDKFFRNDDLKTICQLTQIS